VRIKFSKKPQHVWNTDTSKPKKANTNEESLPQRRWSHPPFSLFCYGSKPKKRQTLTNERARWYKIGFFFSFETNLFYITLQKKSSFSQKKFPRLVLQLSTYCDGKKWIKNQTKNRFLKYICYVYFYLLLDRIYKPQYDYHNFSPLANGTDLNWQKYTILPTHWHWNFFWKFPVSILCTWKNHCLLLFKVNFLCQIHIADFFSLRYWFRRPSFGIDIFLITSI
jgi:hypothetical protein